MVRKGGPWCFPRDLRLNLSTWKRLSLVPSTSSHLLPPTLHYLLGLQRLLLPPHGLWLSPSPPSHSPMYHPCPPFLTYQWTRLLPILPISYSSQSTMSIFFSFLLLFFFFPIFILASSDSIFPDKCNETCGPLAIPLPFHLYSSLPIDLFHAPLHLSCIIVSTLLLPFGSLSLRVLRFLSKAIVVDLSDGYCHKYSDLSLFPIDSSSQFYGIAKENLLKLYGCEDSSICRFDCAGGEKNDSFSSFYSLSDGHIG